MTPEWDIGIEISRVSLSDFFLILFDEIVSWLHKYISSIKIDLKNIQDQIKKLRVYITIFCCESDPIKHMILWVILSL